MNDRPSSDDSERDELLLNRRRVLQLMAASVAMSGAACSGPPAEKIVPYVTGPERQLPGTPVFYATSVLLGGYGQGVLVEVNEGRPTKVEGNPLHPASLGSTDLFAQASVLQLWDPARSQTLLHDGQIASWDQFISYLEPRLSDFERSQGEGLYLLTGNVTSPTLQTQLQQFRERYPQAHWHQYEPLHRDNEVEGARLAFGRVLDTRYLFSQAQIVLTLDADVLTAQPSSVRYARDLASLRNPDSGAMSRVYAVESFPGLIGAKADQRLALAPADIERFIVHLAHRFDLGPEVEVDAATARFAATVARDFRSQPGKALILPGASLSPALYALVHALNHRLGGQGVTFEHTEPVAHEPASHIESMRSLTNAMAAGEVKTLVILGGNPAYDAPADLDFATHLKSVSNSIHLSTYVNETSALCRWHVPRTHEFEHWSDVRAFDGTASIVQPLIAPLYGGRSPHELMNVLLRTPSITAHQIVQSYWKEKFKDDDALWRKALRDGVIADTRSPAINVMPRQIEVPIAAPREGFVANFIADQNVRDGEFSSNAWLQEIPRSMSKLTWDNAVYISPRTAERLKLENGDEVELRSRGVAVRGGIWLLPGHAENCVTLPLGYGRTRAGAIGNGIGFDAYRLRNSDAPWNAVIEIVRTGRQRRMVATQTHSMMRGRHIIRTASAEEFARNPDFANASEQDRTPAHSLYPEHRYDGYKWGMVIDLNACIGCNVCTIACQAENNIPVVGKDEVARGREMHWIRVDRYYSEDNADSGADFQPVPCMHCEHAPCEEVCPVGATVHDSQGLNLQVYNRCVGTRFCSNNCPYKVRRFNFLQYSTRFVESLKGLENPEVTVRQRGVMEKCTYCIQRIQRGRITAEELGRRIQDGEVKTACQSACPTQAISFGDLNDPNSQVTALKTSPRNYALLAELNTRPRTTYLAQVTNAAQDDADG